MSSSRPSPPDVGLVLVAAGTGARIGGEPKQFRPIGGVPMLLRALRPFTAHPEVGFVVVVLPTEQATHPPKWLVEVAGDRLRLVSGGAERTDSVLAGLDALPRECTTVLVHDAARPFPSDATISSVIAIARRGAGAVAAIPVSDTLKRARERDGEVEVEETVSRAGLWRAQTPQGFPRALLQEAHAHREERAPTDDAQLVERLGARIVLVPDTPRNFKVTTTEDLELADAAARTER